MNVFEMFAHGQSASIEEDKFEAESDPDLPPQKLTFNRFKQKLFWLIGEASYPQDCDYVNFILSKLFRSITKKRIFSDKDWDKMMSCHIIYFKHSVKNRKNSTGHTNGNPHKKDVFIESLFRNENYDGFYSSLFAESSREEKISNPNFEEKLKGFVESNWPKLVTQKPNRKELTSFCGVDPFAIMNCISDEEIERIHLEEIEAYRAIQTCSLEELWEVEIEHFHSQDYQDFKLASPHFQEEVRAIGISKVSESEYHDFLERGDQDFTFDLNSFLNNTHDLISEHFEEYPWNISQSYACDFFDMAEYFSSKLQTSSCEHSPFQQLNIEY